MALVVAVALISTLVIPSTSYAKLPDDELKVYRDRVVEMFQHAYDSYMQHAYPYDELRPLSCDGVNTWGSFSLTLIDALDTLSVMGNYSEFRRVAAMIAEKMDFNININVSVFETNIRVVGGLLSAHLLSRRAGVEVEPGWPCSGPLLRLAEDVANRLLPAFATKTGMPYGTVNLVTGVPRGETSVTCTAGVGTFLLEFATLSRLTGNPVFEKTALRALRALWKARSAIGLVGNHIDVQTGRWTAVDAGIGAGVDSYFEYLVKGSIMLQMPELARMFKAYKGSIEKYMRHDDWFFWVSMSTGQVTMPVFQSLEAFWPGMLTLTGDLDGARKSLYNYHQVWRQYGFTPEFYDVVHSQVNSKRDGYPLRPELVESVMYLYQATRDPHLLEIGVDILESISHSARTDCGYATIRKVQDHELEDRMESFFLAETTKYLYLLFTPDHFIHNNGSQATVVQTPSGQCVLDAGGYVFNTEAHPIDIAAVHCCSADKVTEDAALERLEELLDLSKLLVDQRREEFVRPLDEVPGDDLRDSEGADAEDRAESVCSNSAESGEATVARDVDAHTGDADVPGAAEGISKDHDILIAGSETNDGSALGAELVGSDATVIEEGSSQTSEDSNTAGLNIATAQESDPGTIAAEGDSFGTDSSGDVKVSGEEVETVNAMAGKAEAGAADTGRHNAVTIGVEALEMGSVDSEPDEVRVTEEPTSIPVSEPDVGVKVDLSQRTIFHLDHFEHPSNDRPDGRTADGNEEHAEDHSEDESQHPFWQLEYQPEGSQKHIAQRDDVADHKTSEACEGGPDEADPESCNAGAKVIKAEVSRDTAAKNSDAMDSVSKFNRTRDKEGPPEPHWRAEVTEIDLSENDESELGRGAPERVDSSPDDLRFAITGKGKIEELKNFLANAVRQATAGSVMSEPEEEKVHSKLATKPRTAATSDAAKFAEEGTNWAALTCPSQPFTSRLAFRGEMFNVD